MYSVRRGREFQRRLVARKFSIENNGKHQIPQENAIPLHCDLFRKNQGMNVGTLNKDPAKRVGTGQSSEHRTR